ncbi:MAG: IPT/TIG domain-containing protein, partial [Candidatus Kapaibacteriota bacterium]
MNTLATSFRLQTARILVAPFVGILSAVQARISDSSRFMGHVVKMRFSDSPFRQLGSLLVLLFCIALPTHIFAQVGTVTTFAGSGTAGWFDATGTGAQFSYSTGVCNDGAGNIFVADNFNNRIRRIVIATGVVTTIAGNGTAGYVDGTGTGAQFNGPTGICTDGAGNLYVADYNNSCIRRIVIATGVVTTFVGNGTAGFVDGTGTGAQFSAPAAVCSDGAGNLFVADNFNHAIRRIVIATAAVTTLAGNGSSGFVDGTGAAARFNRPFGICSDGAGNLFVADRTNHSIRRIVIATAAVTTLAGNGTLGFVNGTGTAAQFRNPIGICIDGAGNLFVGDFLNHSIRQIVIATAVVTTLAGNGSLGYVDALGTAAQFNSPNGVCLDGLNNLVVADANNNRIRRVVISVAPLPPTVTGFVPTSAYALQAVTINGTNFTGATQVQFGGVTSPWFQVVSATQIRAVVPIGGASGLVSVTTGAGTGTQTGFTFTATPQVSTLAGDGTASFLDAVGAGAQFNSPARIVSDGAGGNLYVADFYNHRIRRINIATGVVTTLAGSGVAGFLDATGTAAQFNNPHALWFDGAGNLYVSDGANGARIRRIVIATGAVTSFAGTGVSGFVNGPAASAQFNGIQSLTGDGAGNLFVSDFGNNVIRRIVIATGAVSTLAGTGVLGYNDGPGTSAMFDNIYGIGCDGLNVYVCDAANFCIRKIVIATGVVSTLSGTGVAGTADGAAGVAQFLGLTSDMVYDGIGNFFFGDLHRIRRISAATGAVSTVAGSGTAGFADGTGVAAQFNFFSSGITRDAAGNLYIADSDNHRIRRLVFPPPTVTSFVPTSAYALQAVTINGTNFTGATQVQFGGVNAAWFTVVSATQIRAVVPIGGASGNVSVTTGLGTGSLAGFTFTATPRVSSFAGQLTGGYLDAVGGGAQFNLPNGVGVDASGNIYVVEQSNHRIRKITAAGVVTTFAGSGVAGFADNTGVLAQFSSPSGVACDAAGNVYIGDEGNHCIRRITPGGVVTT